MGWVIWHLPGEPVGLASRWAATNVEVGKMPYAANRGRVRREEKEGSEGQSHKEEKRGSETGEGPGALS